MSAWDQFLKGQGGAAPTAGDLFNRLQTWNQQDSINTQKNRAAKLLSSVGIDPRKKVLKVGDFTYKQEKPGIYRSAAGEKRTIAQLYQLAAGEKNYQSNKKQIDKYAGNWGQDIINAPGQVAGSIVSGLAAPFKRIGEGNAEVLYGITGGNKRDAQVQQQSDMTTQQIVKGLGERYKNAKTASEKKRLREGISRVMGISDKETQQYLDRQKQVIERTDPAKAVGALAEIGLDIGTAGSVKGIQAATTAAKIASGAGIGGAYGAVGTLEQSGSKASIGDYLTNTALGAVAGGVLGGASQSFGKVKSAIEGRIGRKLTKTESNIISNAITDKRRLISATAGKGADVITNKNRLLGVGKVDPNLAVISKGVNPDDLNRLNKINKAIDKAQKVGGINPDVARALMRERTSLIKKIQGNSQRLSDNNISTLSDKVVQVVDKNTGTKQFYRIPKSQEKSIINSIDNNRDGTAIAGQDIGGKVTHITARTPEQMAQRGFQDAGIYGTIPKEAGSALRVKQEAVLKGMENDLGDVATYQSGSYNVEAQKAINLVQNDPVAALDIATGKASGDNIIHEVAVKNALKEEAIKNGDYETIQKIATSPLQTLTSEAAQRLGAEGYGATKLTDPVQAIQDVTKIRKAAIAKRARVSVDNLVPREIDKIRKNIAVVKPKDWQSFIKALEC